MNLIEQEEVKALDIFTDDGLVFVHFTAPVAVFAMNPEQALAFAKSLTEAEHSMMIEGPTDGKVH